jgi:hypothetical protein
MDCRVKPGNDDLNLTPMGAPLVGARGEGVGGHKGRPYEMLSGIQIR